MPRQGKSPSAVKSGKGPTKSVKQNPKEKAAQKAPQGTQKTGSPFRRRLVLKLCVVFCVLLAGWLVYLDAVVREKFEGKMWAIPASVYARPLELYAGAALNADLLAWELKALGYRQVSSRLEAASFQRKGNEFAIRLRPFHFADEALPEREIKLSIQGDTVVSLAQFNGRSLDFTRVDPLKIGGIYPRQKEDRILIKLDEVPKTLVNALLTIEDRQFYEHHGIAPLSILRAIWVNLTAGGVRQGGSTLTQQLVKNFYLDSRRTIWRKAQEACMSFLLELHYSKSQILEAYLNEIYLGQAGDRAIHGFGMAAQFYFGKNLDQLETEELALLVAMVKGPSYYNPRKNPERATTRRNLVLSELAEASLLKQEEVKGLKSKPLRIAEVPGFSENLYPAFMDLIRRQLDEEYNQSDLESEGLRIFTTLDPQVQHEVEESVVSSLDRLDPGSKRALQAAMVITGAESGEVKAMVGDRNPRFAGFNRALDARRHVGSLIKPAVFLTALEQPALYSLNTLISDQPISIKLGNGDRWEPQNFDKRTYGDVTIHYALTHSLNIATARLGMTLGVNAVIDTLHRLGVDADLPKYPSLFLGAAALSPYEVVRMYQTIAATGFNVPVRSIRSVVTADGRELSRYGIEVKQQFDPTTMHLLQFMMREVMQEGTGKSALSLLPAGLHVAGKTGTTNDQRDSWFAGMTGDYLAVTWVGRDDNEATRLTGATGSLRLWAEAMRRIPQRPFAPIKPEGVEYYWVMDGKSLRTDEGCDGASYLPYLEKYAPEQSQSCLNGFRRIGNWVKSLFE